MNTDTIFALSSGLGKSGVAVIRVSGPDLLSEFESMINITGDIRVRHAYLTNLRDDNDELIDQCIALYFRAPHSFTGEDLIEIHSHGASAVIEKIFSHLRKHGCRMAEPGEFSRRAFYNNKMNLAEVDGLAALLDARTDKQRMFALKSMCGADSAVYESWRSTMIEIAAYSAAILDYPSDELPENIGEKLFDRTQKLYTEITNALNAYGKSRAIRSGFNIVFAGKTNVGKSSIFNRLVGSSRAIVSDIPGTTRDVVSHQIDIDGYLVNLSDTAGIRESDDEIENIGIARTHSEIKNADLILRIYADAKDVKPADDNEIVVLNKSDLGTVTTNGAISVSALNGDGINILLDTIRTKLHSMLGATESDIMVNERTHALLNDAAKELNNALQNTNMDIFAEHVRTAGDAIGKILGVIGVDEIADATFGQLCLGK